MIQNICIYISFIESLDPQDNPTRQILLSPSFYRGGNRRVEIICLQAVCFSWASQVVPVVKNLPAGARDIRDMGSIPGLGRSPGGRHGNPLWYSCLENPHGQRSLVGYSPEGRRESDMTEAT